MYFIAYQAGPVFEFFPAAPAAVGGPNPHWVAGDRLIFDPAPAISVAGQAPADFVPVARMRYSWDGAMLTEAGLAPCSADELASIRAALWERIKAERDRRKAGGTKVGANWFHSDTDSRIQQIGLVLMGAAVPAVPWKLLGGGSVTMSQALAGQVFGAVAASDMALHTYAETLKAQVNAAADPQTIDITAGWPATFGG